jgi:hypothetical protein
MVPHVYEWKGHLPKLKKGKEDSPVEHLLEFYGRMHKMNIHHEDFLMKILMYSLEGHTREWYISFPPSRISSLK